MSQECRQNKGDCPGNIVKEKRTLAKEIKNLTEQEEKVKEVRQVGILTLDELQKRIAPIKLLRELQEQEKKEKEAQGGGNRLTEFCREVAEALDGLTDIDEKKT